MAFVFGFSRALSHTVCLCSFVTWLAMQLCETSNEDLTHEEMLQRLLWRQMAELSLCHINVLGKKAARDDYWPPHPLP